MRSGMSILDRVADFDEAIGEPVAQAVLVEHRHGDVDVGLELDQALARIGHRRLRACLRTSRRSVPRTSRARVTMYSEFILKP